MLIRTLVPVFALSVFAAGLTACAAPVDSEVIDEVSLALGGEQGCKTVTASEVLLQPSAGGATLTSTSTDATYNIDSTCPRQWVAQFSPDSGNSTGFDAQITWADTLPTTQTSCEASALSLGVYRKEAGTWDNEAPATIPKEVHTGVWSGGHCTFPLASTSTDQAVVNGDVIRLAGTAYTTTPCTGGGICLPQKTFKKVSVALQAFW